MTWGRPPQQGGSASQPRLPGLEWPVRSKKRPASRVTRYLALRLCRRNPTPLPCVCPDLSLTLSARCRLDVQQASVCVWSPSRRPALPSNGLLRRGQSASVTVRGCLLVTHTAESEHLIRRAACPPILVLPYWVSRRRISRADSLCCLYISPRRVSSADLGFCLNAERIH